MHLRWIAVTIVSLLAASRPASADDGDWYGWQVMASDAAVVGLFTTAANLDDTWGAAAAIAGAAVYALGAPTLHLAHGKPGAAALSFGLRVGGAALPFLALGTVLDGKGGGSDLASAVVLGAAGAVVGVALDWVLLSHTDPDPPPVMLFSIGGSFR
jgi:hypothetical protein